MTRSWKLNLWLTFGAILIVANLVLAIVGGVIGNSLSQRGFNLVCALFAAFAFYAVWEDTR
jgi:hypothetical protein